MHAYQWRAPIELRPAQKPPVRLTQHEVAVWYRLSANLGEIVPGGDLLWIGWGADYTWNDPDMYVRGLNRQLVSKTIYTLRRLLAAQGGGWWIETVGCEGYRLVER